MLPIGDQNDDGSEFRSQEQNVSDIYPNLTRKSDIEDDKGRCSTFLSDKSKIVNTEVLKQTNQNNVSDLHIIQQR